LQDLVAELDLEIEVTKEIGIAAFRRAPRKRVKIT